LVGACDKPRRKGPRGKNLRYWRLGVLLTGVAIGSLGFGADNPSHFFGFIATGSAFILLSALLGIMKA